MAANVNLLQTQAQCDEALDSLNREKRMYERRDYNQAYTDTEAADRATTTAAQLSKAEDDVTRYTTDVARTGLSASEMRTAQRALINATARRDRLRLTSEAVTGAAAYLADVDADQVDAQLATLQTAIAEVTAHRATVPAA